MNLQAVLDRITPDSTEVAVLEEKVGRLTAEAQAALERHGYPGTASVQGSIAKGTWLRGAADVDLFLLLDPDVPEARLKEVAQVVGPEVLRDCRRKYAQHPYLLGDFEGLDVDLVPAYAVAAAGDRMSAVDRTPFHTQWVLANLEGLSDDVRLAKRWCKGVEVYGADTATGGFSGYLLEVLVIHLGGFDAFIDWLCADAAPRRIATGDDRVDDPVSPLIVVDPVDPTRNCAAAVQEDVLAAAVAAARAYAEAPEPAFFFPAPARPEPRQALLDALAAQDARWIGLELTARTDRLDIVLPQFQKAARRLAEGLDRAGFPVRRTRVDVDDPVVRLQWVLDDVTLPEARIHTGPPADSPHAERFTSKWDGHPDALGPAEADGGRMQVRLRIPHRTPAAWLAHHLPGAALGRHVEDAVQDARIHEDPGVPSPWAPAVADFILDRRPWQRP